MSTITTPTLAGPVVNASDLIAETENHWNVSGTSVLVAWIITAAGGVVIILLYSWRRPKDPMIYLPRIQACKLKQREWKEDGVFVPPVPTLDSGFLGWLKPAIRDILIEIRFWRWRQREVYHRDIRLLELLGLDAVCFLQFLRLLRWLFTAISIFTSIPLLIANYRLNTSTDADPTNTGAVNGSQLDLKVFTAANVKGNDVLVHIGFQLIIFILVALFICLHAYQHNDIVRQWHGMNLNEIAFKTIMVTNLSISRLMPLPKNDAIAAARKKWNLRNNKQYKKKKTVYQAKQEVCAKITGCPAYGKGARVALTHKNMTHIAEMIDEYKSKWFSRFDRVLTAWLRPKVENKQYYASCWKQFSGEAVSVQEAINGAIEKKKEIEKAQYEARDHRNREKHQTIDNAITSAFITVGSAKEAEDIIQLCKKKNYSVAGIGVERAPRSENIVWRNLQLDPKARSGRAITGKVALAIVCFFNTVPLIAITFLANLDSAIGSFPWLRNLVNASIIWKGLFTILAGILPASVAALFGYLLPILMRIIAKWSGALTTGQLDKDVIRQLFMFLLVSNFFLFSLLGVIWETYLSIRSKIGVQPFNEIFGSLGETIPKIAKAYISNSSYWLSWYPVKALTSCVTLLQIPRILLKFVQAYYGCTRAVSAGEFRTIEYSNVIFAAVVGLVYAPLAPLVPIAATVYFWVKSTVAANQLTFVENSPETDGKVWRVVTNRLMVALTLMHLMMILIVAIKTQSWPLPCVALVLLLLTAPLAYFIQQINKTTSTLLLPGSEVGFGSEKGKHSEKEIPQFEHGLLKEDWAPHFHWMPEDSARLELARRQFAGLEELLGRKRKVDVKEEKRSVKSKERLRKGDRDHGDDRGWDGARRKRERRRRDEWRRI